MEGLNHTVYLLRTGTQFYVGSTANLYHRNAMHKSKAKLGSNYKVHQAIRANNMAFEIRPLVHMVGTRQERAAEEQKWIDALEPELNEIRSSVGMPREEYHRQQAKVNYRKNIEKFREYARIRANQTCDCVCGIQFRGPHNRGKHEASAKHILRLRNSSGILQQSNESVFPVAV